MKVGDKVRVKNAPYELRHLIDLVGVIVDANSAPSWCVKFAGLHGTHGLHECGGRTPNSDGRWFYEKDLELAGSPVFNIKMAIDLESVDEATALATKLAAILNAPVQVIHA